MRTFLKAVRAFLVLLLSAVCVFFFYLLYRAPVFGRGERYTLYFGGNSSAEALVTEEPLLAKLLIGKVAGESAEYRGDRYLALKQCFRARLLFCETACGVKNYYLHSPLLGEGVLLCGEEVNLHIVVSGERTAVGTPLIFGGF